MILPEYFNIAIRVAWHLSHKQQDFDYLHIRLFCSQHKLLFSAKKIYIYIYIYIYTYACTILKLSIISLVPIHLAVTF